MTEKRQSTRIGVDIDAAKAYYEYMKLALIDEQDRRRALDRKAMNYLTIQSFQIPVLVLVMNQLSSTGTILTLSLLQSSWLANLFLILLISTSLGWYFAFSTLRVSKSAGFEYGDAPIETFLGKDLEQAFTFAGKKIGGVIHVHADATKSKSEILKLAELALIVAIAASMALIFLLIFIST